MSQTDKIISAMTKGWMSTLDLIKAGGGLTPLSRLAEWRKTHLEYYERKWNGPLQYEEKVGYLHNGKLYKEQTREKKTGNTRIIERRLQRVK